MRFAVVGEFGAGVEGVDFDLVYGGEVAGGGGEEFGDLDGSVSKYTAQPSSILLAIPSIDLHASRHNY